MKLIADGPLLFPLTSPPAIPFPMPNPSTVAKVMDYGDRKVWVTVPFLDTLELIAPVTNEIEINPDVSGKPVQQVYQYLDQSIHGQLKEWSLGDKGFLSLGKRILGNRYTARFDIRYDPDQPLHRAFFWLIRTPGADFGSWQAKLEFSAKKAGAAGLAKIEEAVGLAAPWLSFSAFLKACKVARLDVAIDLIGVEPIDLIGRIKNPGKRIVYVGDHGRPESIYFCEKKAWPKAPPQKMKTRTHGPIRLVFYDRQAHDQQHALPSAHGLAPITRAEVAHRWNSPKRPALSDLLQLTNLLKDRYVAYAATAAGCAKPSKKWRAFCLAVLGSGESGAASAWATSGGFSMAKQYRESAGDLIAPDSWTDWASGVASTGLGVWLNAINAE